MLLLTYKIGNTLSYEILIFEMLLLDCWFFAKGKIKITPLFTVVAVAPSS
jgi:hypothetical protein